MSIEVSLNAGFWNRLMGMLAHPGKATIAAVQKLAFSFPTSVKLTISEARQLLDWGKLARTAGLDWFAGLMPPKLELPKVPLPNIPNIDGGPPGRFQAAVILEPRGTEVAATNVIFSMDRLKTVRGTIEALAEFIEENAGGSPKLEAFLQQYMEKLEQKKDPGVLPNWIIERYDIR